MKRRTEAEALQAVKLCVSLGLDVNAAIDKAETASHGAATGERILSPSTWRQAGVVAAFIHGE
ncbi:MAG: hypothetical protein JOZ32_01880 [Bryobacterales bacterium]|nr:hypothetical protein [Bryobacterales bacterium]